MSLTSRNPFLQLRTGEAAALAAPQGAGSERGWLRCAALHEGRPGRARPHQAGSWQPEALVPTSPPSLSFTGRARNSQRENEPSPFLLNFLHLSDLTQLQAGED